jgi:hypothetical protein
VSAFNFLIAEDRFVGGAFLPSIIVREVDTSIKRILDTSKFYVDNEPNKLNLKEMSTERFEKARLAAEDYDKANQTNSNKEPK